MDLDLENMRNEVKKYFRFYNERENTLDMYVLNEMYHINNLIKSFIFKIKVDENDLVEYRIIKVIDDNDLNKEFNDYMEKNEDKADFVFVENIKNDNFLKEDMLDNMCVRCFDNLIFEINEEIK